MLGLSSERSLVMLSVSSNGNKVAVDIMPGCQKFSMVESTLRESNPTEPKDASSARSALCTDAQEFNVSAVLGGPSVALWLEAESVLVPEIGRFPDTGRVRNPETGRCLLERDCCQPDTVRVLLGGLII